MSVKAASTQGRRAAARSDARVALLRGVNEKVLPGVVLVDSGAAVAGDLARTLARLGIEDRPVDGRRGGGTSSLHAQYHVTDDPERFRSVGARFLGHAIDGPHLVDLGLLASTTANVRAGDHPLEEKR